MEIGTHDYRNRLGDNHPIVNTIYDYVVGCGAATRDDAAQVLDHLPPSFGQPTADERAAVLDRFTI